MKRIDLTHDIDRLSVITRVADVLRGGGAARLATDAGQWGLILATEMASETQLPEQTHAGLLLSDPHTARDLIPEFPLEASRILRRAESPCLLQFEGHDDSLIGMFPRPTRGAVGVGGGIRIAAVSDEIVTELLPLLPAPLLGMWLDGSVPGGIRYDVDVTQSMLTSSPDLSVFGHAEGRWKVLQEGSLSFRQLTRTMAQQIIFVCTGNTCRSPIAEAMFRHMLAERLNCRPDQLVEQGWEVRSAGIAAMQGAPASPESVQICNGVGLDLQAHASQPLSADLLQQADRLYTMTAGHREAILARNPQLADRVEVLARTGEDVIDPIGWGQAAYEQCFAEITEHLRVLIEELTQPTSDRES